MSHSEFKELNQANQLMREGRIKEALQIVLELEKRGDLSSQDLLSCKLLKAKVFRKSSQYSEALKYANQLLDESKEQEDPLLYFDVLLIKAYALIMTGNFSQGNDLIKRAEDVFEKLKVETKINLMERESFMVRIKGIIAGLLGNPHLSIKLNERALELAKDSDDKGLIVSCLLNLAEEFQGLGEYDKAIIYAKRAIEVPYPPWLLISLGYLIMILIDKGDIIHAKFYFQQMSEFIEKDETKYNNLVYRYYKALILKTSLRARDRVNAEEIFKQIVEEKEDFQYMVKALINLCGLLLIELRITNDSDIINEIKPYITMLLNFTEQQQSYYFTAETYLLQGKLFLLTFDIKKAKRFLTQAQQISERFGLTQLSTKIAKENDDFFKKEDLWKKLKEEGAPMVKRVELARLHEQIEEMVRNPTILTAYVREEKVAISKEKKICLVCRGEVIRFSYICECGVIYCGNCAQALTNLENVCWACDIPIDYLKPVKPYQEEVERVEIGEKSKKEMKNEK